MSKHLDEGFMKSTVNNTLVFVDSNNLEMNNIRLHFGDAWERNRFLLNLYTQHLYNTLKEKNYEIDFNNGSMILDTGLNLIESFGDVFNPNNFMYKVNSLLRQNLCLLGRNIEGDELTLVGKTGRFETVKFNPYKSRTFNKKVFVPNEHKQLFVDTDSWEWIPLDCYYKAVKTSDSNMIVIEEQYYSPYIY